MPRRVFTCSRFNGGMILNADPADLGEGFGCLALNTMSALDSGSIGGRYADGEASGFEGVIQSAYITDGNAYHLAFLDADGTLHIDGEIVNYYISALGAKCITGHRNYALIGRGKSEMPLYYGYPKGSAEAVVCENDFSRFTFQGASSDTGSALNASDLRTYFERDATYYYATSIVYDGYMHGPLTDCFSMKIEQGTDSTYGFPTITNRANFHLVDNIPVDMIPRVTSVNLYRAVSASGMLDTTQRSEYTKIHEFTDLTDMNWVDWNLDASGASYGTLSGLDETLSFSTLSYEVAYEMNNFLFVGNIGHIHYDGFYPNGKPIPVQDIPDGSRLLYRSLRGKHCQFSIISDYVALPFTPLEITSFNTRLIVFGEADFAIVNPESMIVEDIVHGYGIESPLCVYSTLSGVFFANKNNMYVFDGREVIPIGTPVIRAWDGVVISELSRLGLCSYEEVVASGGIKKVVYSARVNSVLFLYSGTDNLTFAFVFSLDTKVWSVFSFGSIDARCAYIDRSNVLFIGNRPAIGSEDKVKDWKYITKRFTLGDASQWKKIYALHLTSTNHNQISQASFDSGAFVAINQVEVPEENRRAKSVMVKFDPNEIYPTYLSAIEITYREMANIK